MSTTILADFSNITKTTLTKLELPYFENQIAYLDNCFFTLKRNVLPNGVIHFSSPTEHIIEAYNPDGICECLQVIECELDRSLYSATSEQDPQYQHLLETDPLELKRYTSITINGKVFTELSPELVTEFAQSKSGSLKLHPVSGDFALIYIKVFPSQVLHVEEMLIKCGQE